MRQIVTTRKQMKDAPYKAIYIWCNGYLTYPVNLAFEIGRTDLQIVSPHWLDNSNNWRGRIFSGIVIDHAINDYPEFMLTNEQYKNLMDILFILTKIKNTDNIFLPSDEKEI